MFYGGKIGFILFDLDDYDDPMGLTAVVGYEFWRNISVEGEISTSVADGKANVVGTDLDVTVQTLAAYLAYRNPGETYFKAKVGFLGESRDVGNTSTDDTDSSLGIGYGWQTKSNLRMEVEYTVISSDINYLSFGVLF
jgi:hypothetical protein